MKSAYQTEQQKKEALQQQKAALEEELTALTEKNREENETLQSWTEWKEALQKELGLPQDPDVPMMVMVTRFAGHKGLDLLCYIARRLMWEQDAQMVILGTGEPQYEAFFKDLQAQFPDRVAAKITFNLGLPCPPRRCRHCSEPAAPGRFRG